MAKNHYINNARFLQSIKEFKEHPDRGIPNYIGECFMQIAERLSYKPNFINYTYRDDMIGDAIENCVQVVNNFDPEKSSNPFSFFTQIIYFAFLRRIAKEKKQSYIKLKCIENEGMFDPDFQEHEVSSHTKEFLDQARYVIFDYEEKMNTKKEADSNKRKSKIQLKGLEQFEGNE
jgi:hypothetical protein